MMGHPEAGNSGKVMEALLKMKKLDIAALKAAYKLR
jgi:predicted 3-demethylubiquinone-9 3-methyltransferase (glyoxalase superfamily)